MVATYETKTDYKVIGQSPIRHDGLDKVTGRAIYGGDVKVPALIWGDVIRSPHAHARIKCIDTSAAEAMEGVFAVLTHADFPQADDKTIDTGEGTVNLRRGQSNVMADKKVHYKGHVVAAVAAVDRNTAEIAAQAIKVEYEVLTAITNVDAAMADGAGVILEGLVGDHLGENVENTNVARVFRHEFGNVDDAFANSDLVIERTVEMSMVH